MKYVTAICHSPCCPLFIPHILSSLEFPPDSKKRSSSHTPVRLLGCPWNESVFLSEGRILCGAEGKVKSYHPSCDFRLVGIVAICCGCYFWIYDIYLRNVNCSIEINHKLSTTISYQQPSAINNRKSQFKYQLLDKDERCSHCWNYQFMVDGTLESN